MVHTDDQPSFDELDFDQKFIEVFTDPLITTFLIGLFSLSFAISNLLKTERKYASYYKFIKRVKKHVRVIDACNPHPNLNHKLVYATGPTSTQH